MPRKLIIFGVGSGIDNALKYLNNGDKPICCCDNDTDKQNTTYKKLRVISPQDILSIEFDLILITNSYQKEIFEQLVAMGVDPEKIEAIRPEVFRNYNDNPASFLLIIFALLVLIIAYITN